MAKDISLWGAVYQDTPALDVPKNGGGLARFTDTSDANAVASDLAQGKTAYVNGTKITGTNAGGGGTDFIITLTRDDNDGVWMPDKTFAEIVSAYNAGKTLAVIVGGGEWADTFYYLDSMPDYFVYEVITNGQGADYIFDTNGVTVDFEFPIISPNFDSPSVTYTPSESVQTDAVTYDPNDGYNGIEQVNVTVNAIPSNYVGSGVTRRDWTDVTFDTDEGSVEVPAGYYPSPAGRAMPTGTVNNPTATKGSVSNHAVTVTPSVSFSAGFVGSGSKTGSAVSVSASELVSGSQTLSANGTYDVTNLASVLVSVSGGGVTGVAKGTLNVPSNVGSSTNTKITDTATIGFTPKAFLFYRSDRSATNYHVNCAMFVTLGSSYYIGTRTRYSSSSSALSTSGNTTNWTTQSSGYLYFNNNNIYFRSSSSYILPSGTWNWVAIQ